MRYGLGGPSMSSLRIWIVVFVLNERNSKSDVVLVEVSYRDLRVTISTPLRTNCLSLELEYSLRRNVSRLEPVGGT